MKKITLLLLLASLGVNAQTFTRSFPLEESPFTFIMGSSAPIVSTPDNGYLLNYSFSYPNWDVAPGYQSLVVKTDADFVPVWSKRLPSGNGKKTIVLDDGSSVFFSDEGVITRVDASGQTLFSKGNFVSYPDRLAIEDAELFGSTVRVIGSKNTYNGFGYITVSVPLIIDFDLEGNVLQAFAITGVPMSPVYNSIFKDDSGNCYISGYSSNSGNFLCKLNSANVVQWCKTFRHTNLSSSIAINDAIVLADGNILLAGRFYNYSTSFGSFFLYLLSGSGAPIATRTNEEFAGGVNSVSQLEDGEVIATGTLSPQEGAFSRTFAMSLDQNLGFNWSKFYSEGFAMSAPFVANDSKMYYTAFQNNYDDVNRPILFNTDSEGNTSCPLTEMSVDFVGVPMVFSSANLTLVASPTALGLPSAYDPFSVQSQAYSDDCANLSVDLPASTKLVVYPNPSKGEIHIVSSSEIASVQVVNALGQIVQTHKPNQLETSITIENPGFYLLQLQTANESRVAKVTVAK